MKPAGTLLLALTLLHSTAYAQWMDTAEAPVAVPIPVSQFDQNTNGIRIDVKAETVESVVTTTTRNAPGCVRAVYEFDEDKGKWIPKDLEMTGVSEAVCIAMGDSGDKYVSMRFIYKWGSFGATSKTVRSRTEIKTITPGTLLFGCTELLMKNVRAGLDVGSKEKADFLKTVRGIKRVRVRLETNPIDPKTGKPKKSDDEMHYGVVVKGDLMTVTSSVNSQGTCVMPGSEEVEKHAYGDKVDGKTAYEKYQEIMALSKSMTEPCEGEKK